MSAPVLNRSIARSLVWLLALPACSALVHPDTAQLDPQPVACSPGAVAQCPCLDGHWSQQQCNAGGSFDPCACGVVVGQPGGNSGTGGRSGTGGSAGMAGSSGVMQGTGGKSGTGGVPSTALGTGGMMGRAGQGH